MTTKMVNNEHQWQLTTTNAQPGEVHRAAHLPPVHLHTLVAIDKDFQNWLSSPPWGDKMIMILTVIVMLMLIMMIMIRKPWGVRWGWRQNSEIRLHRWSPPTRGNLSIHLCFFFRSICIFPLFILLYLSLRWHQDSLSIFKMLPPSLNSTVPW